MKIIIFLPILISIVAVAADKPQLHYMQEALAHATVDEKKDMQNILGQIEVIPLKQKHKGQTVFRIINIDKNSPFEKAGFKEGDLVLNGFAPKSEAAP